MDCEMATEKLAACYVFLAFTIISGCVLRVAGINSPSLTDDASYLYQAKEIYLGSRPYEDVFISHPPLYHYLTAAVYKLLGVGIAQGRLVSVFFSMASIPLVFVVSKRFYGFGPSLLATFVFSLSHGVIFLTKNVFLGSEPLFFGLLSSYLFLAGVEEESRVKLTLSGIAVGISALGRLTGALPLLVMAAFFLIRRRGLKKISHVLTGFFAILLPFALVFYSGDFLGDLLIYHLHKEGFDFFSRIKLGLAVLVSFYPILIPCGLVGLAEVLFSSRRSDADVFYSVNVVLALMLSVFATYNKLVNPAVYLVSSSYAFAVLGGKIYRRLDLPNALLFLLLFAVTTVQPDIRMLSCDGAACEFGRSVNLTVDYVRENSRPGDYVLVDGYPLYYIPLLSDARIVPKSELNTYRFTYDLDFGLLRELKGEARYVVVYDDPEGARDFSKMLSAFAVTPNKRMEDLENRKREALLENTQLVAKFGKILLYENLDRTA